ncbi:Hypothetical predicted protein [Lecanosticta acicola]|uniref:Uncharacterized protein n=1 Tax=Lecanosticta acicola TaxID=111012 RepID=A0AAI8Z3G6_9PEZI|nr:Hypothetical predicted protein [Lecanosticta acicola]
MDMVSSCQSNNIHQKSSSDFLAPAFWHRTSQSTTDCVDLEPPKRKRKASEKNSAPARTRAQTPRAKAPKKGKKKAATAMSDVTDEETVHEEADVAENASIALPQPPISWVCSSKQRVSVML